MNASFTGGTILNERMKITADEAAMLFLRQGYSKTQISHIAKAVGVSVGTIYLDFIGKKEILNFILASIIDPDFVNHEFERPISNDLFIGIETKIVTLFEDIGTDFSRHLENNASDYTFGELISDAFDLLAQYAVGCLFIEKNYFDFKYLSDHYREYRKKFFAAMRQYLSIFMDRGDVRQLEDLDLNVMYITETLSWWAMDMRYTSFETSDIPLESAKKICLDNITAAYKKQN